MTSYHSFYLSRTLVYDYSSYQNEMRVTVKRNRGKWWWLLVANKFDIRLLYVVFLLNNTEYIVHHNNKVEIFRGDIISPFRTLIRSYIYTYDMIMGVRAIEIV